TAEALGVPYAVNDLFIDNSNDVDEIMAQIRRGLNLAKRNGQAIIIGHVRPRTASALWRMIPEIMDSGVELVPVSTLLVTPARD
ncbi:MAG: divergent polysaccharide deacetylase family protein, partial [Firmicutes bacterium]|nr:divergent polysaccharide deacetylase family protein [Bacillota bacterium]